MDADLARIDYVVPYADTDQMKVVYYANYLVYFERARSAALQALGYPYSRMEQDGYLLPIAEAHAEYLKPARYEDRLTLTCRFEQLSKVRVKAVCEVYRDQDLLARGHTIHVCYAAGKQRPTRMPSELLEALNGDVL